MDPTLPSTSTSTVEDVIGLTALNPDMKFTDPAVSKLLDENDELRAFRNEFEIPTNRGIKATLVPDDKQNGPCTYFVGNSLGPLAKRSRELVIEELNVWSDIGVQGHFAHPLNRDWMTLASKAVALMAPMVGAKESEVACMSTLTANLHLLMTSFYKPAPQRYKILCEYRAFPSDEYAFSSQAALHGLSPENDVIRLRPRPGEHYLRESDILDAIKEHGSSLALVLFSGIQYYTGQWFPMQKITRAAHDVGAICGWDCAHAAGNVPLSLHDWDVDFAVWCTYKYMNSGPGGIGGLFIHEKWVDKEKPKMAGWWGHDEATRFQMPDRFSPIPGAQGFQQSNPSTLNIAALLGSLELFERAGGINVLRRKAIRTTAYLEALLKASPYYLSADKAGVAFESNKPAFTIITPSERDSRGTQLSLLFSAENMPVVFEEMTKRGVIGDERHPGIIRYAPSALYCTFEDCRRTAELLNEVLAQLE